MNLKVIVSTPSPAHSINQHHPDTMVGTVEELCCRKPAICIDTCEKREIYQIESILRCPKIRNIFEFLEIGTGQIDQVG